MLGSPWSLVLSICAPCAVLNSFELFSACLTPFAAQCTHHDGSVWTSGKQVVDASGSTTSALASSATGSLSSSRERKRPIERAAVALSMARETRQSILAKSKGSKRSSISGISSSNSEASPSSSASSRLSLGRSKVTATYSAAVAEEKSSPWVESCFDRSCRCANKPSDHCTYSRLVQCTLLWPFRDLFMLLHAWGFVLRGVL